MGITELVQCLLKFSLLPAELARISCLVLHWGYKYCTNASSAQFLNRPRKFTVYLPYGWIHDEAKKIFGHEFSYVKGYQGATLETVIISASSCAQAHIRKKFDIY